MAKAGNPAKYKTPKELQDKIDQYFKQCDEKDEPYLITGLAYFLGFEDRQSIYDYQKNPKFSCIIKRARLKVESGYEMNMHRNNPTGSIFVLKNMGWRDDHNQNISIEDMNDISKAFADQIRKSDTGES